MIVGEGVEEIVEYRNSSDLDFFENKSFDVIFEGERFKLIITNDSDFHKNMDRSVIVMAFPLDNISNEEYCLENIKNSIDWDIIDVMFVDQSRLLSGNENIVQLYFYIIFSNEEFRQIIGDENYILRTLDDFLVNEEFSFILNEKLNTSAEMNFIIHEIITCKKEGVLKKIFIEAKVLKLLMLQLEQLEQIESLKKLKMIKDYDIDKIIDVKKIIDGNISKSYSLIELAHMVGLNDFKLKRGFKELYKTTVFNYLYEIRMLEAKKSLLNTNKSIGEIAALCGYEFAQSFIKAFKRKHGVSPDKFRNSVIE